LHEGVDLAASENVKAKMKTDYHRHQEV
jgi:hypothetical protein